MDSDTEIMAGGDGVSIHAGFPNPAADRRRSGQSLSLDLNQLLIQNSLSTYLFRIAGHQWAGQGIFDGDIAIIDRALPPMPNDMIILWENSSFCITKYRNLVAQEEPWGVITATIHQYDR